MNNILKSVFIGAYPLVALVVFIYALLNMLNTGFSLSALGLMLIAAPILIFLLIVFTTTTARTSKNLDPYTLIVTIGLILAFYDYQWQGGDLNLFLIALAIFPGWGLYIWWYSVFQDRPQPTGLEKGHKLPEFTVEDKDGNEISSKQFIGSKAIIMFFRGNWCPLCMAQIKELAAMYKELENRSIQTILISPQPHRHTKSLAKRFDLNFQFLVDKDLKAAKQLELFAENGLPMGLQALGYENDTVMPTIILTDENGLILHSDLTENYRIRPEPKAFLEVFDGRKNAK